VLGVAASAVPSRSACCRRLLERGIRPDHVVGSSIGAITDVHVAADPSPAGIESSDSRRFMTLHTELPLEKRIAMRAWRMCRADIPLGRPSGVPFRVVRTPRRVDRRARRRAPLEGVSGV